MRKWPSFQDNTPPTFEIQWEGPGWYCTTQHQGHFITWRIPDQEGLDDLQERDRASRSYGGPITYYEAPPAH